MKVSGEVLGVAAVALALLALTGCSGSTTPNPTTSVTAPTQVPPPTATKVAPTPSPSPVVGTPPCATAQLTGAVQSGAGAAGTTVETILLTNRGTAACALQGWPGTSWVGGGNGSQIGQPATFDRADVRSTVTVGPGKSAAVTVKIFRLQRTGLQA